MPIFFYYDNDDARFIVAFNSSRREARFGLSASLSGGQTNIRQARVKER
jgi:hypothetical protein